LKALLITIGLGVAMAFAGSQGSAYWGAWPVFALCAMWAFAIQWLAFIPAYLLQTEKFYDLTGSLTYISAVLLAVGLSGPMDLRSGLLAVFIVIWAVRLGSFLFKRIHEDGSDSRFDKIKPSPLRFFNAWCIQGLWVVLTAACALAAISSSQRPELSVVGYLGCALWLFGFLVEVIADRQKRAFRKANGSDQFITSGLWSVSRHPNYVGEILLWVGIALLALPALSSWQYVTLISPVFVYVLLTRVSGVPLLERKSDKRWGGQEQYDAYKAATPVLFPIPWLR
jgi:steroid 5-alpha reductase family enzyme